MKTTDEEIERAEKELDTSKLESRISFEMDALQLMAVHGACCLGLRHPAYIGPSRSLVLKFIEMAEKKFVECGLMKPEHIRIIHKVEQQETEKINESHLS